MNVYHWLRDRPALHGFVAIRVAAELAEQMLNVAVGWYVYAATGNPLSLAYVGLAQFLPDLCLLLLAGHAADRISRRKLIGLALLVQMASLAAFAVWSAGPRVSVLPVYGLLLVVGTARAFFAPAQSAIQPHTVSEEELPRAVAVASSGHQLAALAGPALGGLLLSMSGPLVFGTAAVLCLLGFLHVRLLPAGGGGTGSPQEQDVLAGIRAIRANRLLLGLVSLDLFAVLLGGVGALLPIFARDILAAGPMGLGLLRAAPGVGAALVGLALARHPIKRGAGRLMLACVAGFGAATIVFALSRNLWLSLAALAVAGGFDMVSMVVRQTLVQLATPDALRGRVSAVSWLFIGASAALGDVESGVAAALLGAMPAALLGGAGTVAVVALWLRLFPEICGSDRFKTNSTP